MFEALPIPELPLLAQAPVQLATFQMDFAEERPLVPKDGIAWQKAISARGYRVPRLVGVKQSILSVRISAREGGAANVMAEREGWQVFFEDGNSNASIYATGINVERYKYPGFAIFREEITNIITAAMELFSPQVVTKISLTYSNALSDSEAHSVDFWRAKVRPEFLGAVQRSALSPNFERSLMVNSWTNTHYKAEMSTAIQPDQVFPGRVAYVFQTQMSRSETAAFDLPELEIVVDELHSFASRLFGAVLQETYLDELRNLGTASSG